MKLIGRLFSKIKKSSLKYKGEQQETLIKQGNEQFKKLMEKGLGVPVALL